MLDLSFRFDLWFASLPSSPKDRGAVAGCVRRTGPGLRETPERLELAPGEGVLGDTWKVHPHSSGQNEVSLMNVHVLRSVAEGDPARMALSGDNLQVDLDLSEENLPVGTRLVVGEVELEVSPKPHRPCRHFVERFGATAAKKVARADRRGKRGRGVLCTIVRGGRVAVGDPIAVRRPARLAP